VKNRRRIGAWNENRKIGEKMRTVMTPMEYTSEETELRMLMVFIDQIKEGMKSLTGRETNVNALKDPMNADRNIKASGIAIMNKGINALEPLMNAYFTTRDHHTYTLFLNIAAYIIKQKPEHETAQKIRALVEKIAYGNYRTTWIDRMLKRDYTNVIEKAVTAHQKFEDISSGKE